MKKPVMTYNQRMKFENFLWLAAGACYMIAGACLIASSFLEHPKSTEERLQACNFEEKQNKGCLHKLGE